MIIIASLIISVAGLRITYVFSKATKEIENDKMLKELFTEFNSRYNRINDNLYLITSKYASDISEMTIQDKNVVYDYFNLCAEEYFWYKKGRIDYRIWSSWCSGMKFWFNKEIISALWKEETTNKDGLKSYYLNDAEKFFFES